MLVGEVQATFAASRGGQLILVSSFTPHFFSPHSLSCRALVFVMRQLMGGTRRPSEFAGMQGGEEL